MKKTNKLIVIIVVIFSITTYIGCKKELLEGAKSTPVKYSNRYQGEIFSDTRSYENAILAIEYELNMEVADTNMLSGITDYDNVFIDSFYYDAYTFTGDEVIGTDQESIYEDIRDIVLDSLNNHYDNSSIGNAIVIDLSVEDFNENVILVKYVRSTIVTGCSCSFTTNLPWSDLNNSVKNCNYFDDKANNYYANCMPVIDNIGQYYDVIIDYTPNGGLVYFTGGDISSATGTTVYLDESMTPTEQIVTRDFIYDFSYDITSSDPDGRTELLNVQIGGTVGFQNALYIKHLIRGKFSVGLPF